MIDVVLKSAIELMLPELQFKLCRLFDSHRVFFRDAMVGDELPAKLKGILVVLMVPRIVVLAIRFIGVGPIQIDVLYFR
ncbi:MAG: hypothetical protein ACK5X1_08430, partial [Betaproteobacteria bacterium]